MSLIVAQYYLVALEEKPGSTQRTYVRRDKKYNKKIAPMSASTKIGGRVVLAVIGVIVLYLFITFLQVYHDARTDAVGKKTHADAILVLGAAQYNGTPSPVLKARLDHALDLYKSGVAPYIIVTGGNQPGDTTTEAATGANYFLNRGVPDAKILREVQGKSTYDSLRDSAVFAKQWKIKKIVIVTDGFHELRSNLIASSLGLHGIDSPAKNSPIKGATEWKNFFTETARVSLGRIIGFRRVSSDSSLAHLVK